MDIEHQELANELSQDRSFAVLERQSRIDNVESMNEVNRANSEYARSQAELHRAKASFWRSLSAAVFGFFVLGCTEATIWLIAHWH